MSSGVNARLAPAPTIPPSVDGERLASAVERLAERVDGGDVRAGLHALAGILRNLTIGPRPDAGRERLEHDLAAAVGAGRGAEAIDAAARLAAADRAALSPVDWTAASGG